MMIRRLMMPAAALCLALAGCAQPRNFTGYLADRSRDLVETVRLSAGVGLGLHARAAVTSYLFVGEGYAYTHMFGWDGAAGVNQWQWNRLAASAGIPFVMDYDVDARALDPGADWSVFTRLHYGEKQPKEFAAKYVSLTSCVFLSDSYLWTCNRRTLLPGTRQADFYWVEADATALVLSARAGINLAELADFVGGLFCLDMLGDDRFVIPSLPEPKEPKAKR